MRIAIWSLVGLLLATSLAVLGTAAAPVNAAWIVAAALCTYAIGYRFYARFVAARAAGIDAGRVTPARARADGQDYVPTHRVVLFGHHFAAIAGAGPLVGPVLAAQMGYLPGLLWLLAGVVLAGAVQDFLVLAFSVRRGGRSLGEMIRLEMGPAAGAVASAGVLAIMVILLAVLALVVVRALAHSPWGLATVLATIPIALLMGVYARFVRPGRLWEMSAIGLVLLLAALWGGGALAARPGMAAALSLSGETLAWGLMAYGFLASVLPVWLLLAPRDYLSTFLKIGTIAALALGILITLPVLHMPAVTRFVDGTGPVFAGPLFPFLFITIACGAVSGFHALVASGTTPKMLGSEADAPMIGYGAMLAESAVAVMALIAASVLPPGAYFAMNAPPAAIGATVSHAAAVISGWGFPITADALTGLAHDVGEASILSRSGGAPTLAVGMAQIFSSVLGGRTLMAFWYHFAILFEALFILTTIDAGTRVARFMIEDMAAALWPGVRRGGVARRYGATALAVGGWGFFLIQGVRDPLGGINTLWPLFGIANQMLAAIALTLCTVVLFKLKRQRVAFVTLLPLTWLAVCTLTAGAMKLASPVPAIGFIAHARGFLAALRAGRVAAPAATLAEMRRVVANDAIDAAVVLLLMAIVLTVLAIGARACWLAWRREMVTAQELVDVPAAGGAATITRCC